MFLDNREWEPTGNLEVIDVVTSLAVSGELWEESTIGVRNLLDEMVEILKTLVFLPAYSL